jgi:hypothetical protein
MNGSLSATRRMMSASAAKPSVKAAGPDCRISDDLMS